MVSAAAGESFSQRLIQACDDSTIIPEYGKGRQVAIAKRLAVTQEAVRKWFTGEAVPRPEKMRELAEYLEVDEPWRALGIKPELSRNDRRRYRSALDGAVHLVSGLIMLEGGHCAFPSEKDPHADRVDVYAIMRGTQMAIHVSLARGFRGEPYSKVHEKLTVPTRRERHDIPKTDRSHRAALSFPCHPIEKSNWLCSLHCGYSRCVHCTHRTPRRMKGNWIGEAIRSSEHGRADCARPGYRVEFCPMLCHVASLLRPA